jgi:uncharacterized phage-associated protein
MLRVIEAAEYILWLGCQQENDLISNLKLQKLLYYSQGYSLARLGRTLFDAPIQAWQHGPVVKEVYRAYKEYDSQAIPCPHDIRLNKYQPVEREIMDEVYGIYGQFSAWALRDMTHQEPLWQNATEGEVIGVGRLREYFLSRAEIRPLIVQTHKKDWDEVAEQILRERHSLWEKLARV